MASYEDWLHALISELFEQLLLFRCEGFRQTHHDLDVEISPPGFIKMRCSVPLYPHLCVALSTRRNFKAECLLIKCGHL